MVAGEGSKNLNYVLSYNGIGTNVTRDNSVYKANPTFWATRPLTPKMIAWASSDVDKLLMLATKQEESLSAAATSRGWRSLDKANRMAQAYIGQMRDIQCQGGIQCKIPHGHFIGRGGENIKRVISLSGAKKIVLREGSGWLVYYEHEHQLQYVKRAMGYGG